MVMVIAMAMMSSKRKPPSMPPSQDEAHTVIGDFIEITVSNSDNDLHLGRVTSGRLDGRMPDISEVEIWRTVSLWMFLLSLLFLFSLLHYFFGSRPSTNGVGSGFYHLRRYVKWRWSFPVRRICRKVALSGTDRLSDLWVRTFAYVEQLFDCCHSFLLLYGIMQPWGSAPKEGDNVMARLHVTCPGPGNTRFI